MVSWGHRRQKRRQHTSPRTAFVRHSVSPVQAVEADAFPRLTVEAVTKRLRGRVGQARTGLPRSGRVHLGGGLSHVGVSISQALPVALVRWREILKAHGIILSSESM